MARMDKHEYYLDIADTVSMRGTCLRRNYGAVIVNNDVIVGTGYVGAPRGRANCCDVGYCYRQAHNIPRGTQYETCRSVHAEQNAIINAGRDKCIGATLYLSGREVDTGNFIKNADCCSMCKRLIINAGIETVVIKQYDDPGEYNYDIIPVNNWVKEDDSLSDTVGY